MKLLHRGNCVLVKYTPNQDEASGLFDEVNGRIYISSKLPPLQRECIYYHELTHKECYESKCKCWDTSDYLLEYHAMRGELHKVLARNSIALNRAYLKTVETTLAKCARDPKLWRAHGLAMNKLMRTKAFKRIRKSV